MSGKAGTLRDQASSECEKCALAMALLHNPSVLFLDEPFEGIDPVSSRNIKDLYDSARQPWRHDFPDFTFWK